MGKSRQLILGAALAAIWAVIGASVSTAQISDGIDILPVPNVANLNDLNDVVLFRSAYKGTQAFEGPIEAKSYVVGPGDIIEINIWAPRARNFLLTVTPEGSLLIPGTGEINVSGMLLDSARGMIVGAVLESFPSSDVTATLVQARRVRVHVSGLVGVPGTYELTASQRLSDAVAAARGVTPQSGSARRVMRVTPYGTSTYDLLAFFALGSAEDNPYLVGGDYIVVPPRDPVDDHIEIGGAVLRPGKIEFLEGDRVSDLLLFAYGEQPRADITKITLTRTDPATGRSESHALQASFVSGTYHLDNDMPLQRRDRVFVSYLPTSGRTATSALFGEVTRPGHYAMVEDSSTLGQLVELAGGLTPRASLHEAVFLRPSAVRGPRDTIPPLVSVQLERILAGDSQADITLKHRDSIYVPSRSLTVQVVGRVRRPGLLTYSGGESVSGYIERAGGYGMHADKRSTRVIRAVSGAVEKPDSDRPPQPGDQILVPEGPPVALWRKLRDGLTFVSALATTYFVIQEIAK
jgi:protein involved in polysaccharide export with SLBB domain